MCENGIILWTKTKNQYVSKLFESVGLTIISLLISEVLPNLFYHLMMVFHTFVLHFDTYLQKLQFTNRKPPN